MIDILRQKSLFPLKNFEDVENLFAFNLDINNGEPNLTLLSVVAGLIEHSLVNITDKEDLALNSRPVDDRKDIIQKKFAASESKSTTNLPSSPSQSHYPLSSTSNDLSKDHQHLHQRAGDNSEFNEAGHVSPSDESGGSPCSSSFDLSARDNLQIPEIEFEIVETLYRKFVDQFKGSIDLKDIEKTNLKIKKISDSVWEHLSNSYYKDKPHLQSIFSYLTTSKLDCFGLAFAVIAGCQILNLKNVYLALSEDHAWVMFNLQPEEYKALKEQECKEYTEKNLPIPACALHGTCEVTWHGKINSVKRGQPVTYKNCWLYVDGYAVKCDTRRCVAALVNSINPTINTNTDSETLALLQQRLLWYLYEQNNYFPMSLGKLGELENICLTPNAPLNPLELFNLGIDISRIEYNDSHVYPYSYLASFFFKHGRFKEALETWADASAVLTKYNYSRDDEEIYNEFLQVANDLIPSMLKVLTAGGLEPGKVSTKPSLQDPECLALILKFYDNICVWEEGSSTPVLHIKWARNFIATVLKFSSIIRSKIKLLTEDEWTQSKACASEFEVSSRADHCSSTGSDNIPETNDSDERNNKRIKKEPLDYEEDQAKPENSNERDGNRAHLSDHKVDTSESASAENQKPTISTLAETRNKQSTDGATGQMFQPREKRFEVDGENVTVILKSRKIAGVRDLLPAERLNKGAIELQLTAQSQCAVRGRSNSSSYSSDFISTAFTSTGGSTRSKRLHR